MSIILSLYYLFISLFLFLLIFPTNGQYLPPKYGWKLYTPEYNISQSVKEEFKNRQLASRRINQPVYISLTTINARLNQSVETIQSIINSDLLPTEIFLFLSESPFLLDSGVDKSELKYTKLELLLYKYPFFHVIFTDNIGPHRKLIPLLSRKWKEDCIIITVDDHIIYPKDMISSLLDYYIASNKKSIVALRTRRIGLCAEDNPWRIAPYPRKGNWPIAKTGRQELLIIPTGAGGVLYRPRFFANYVFDPALRNLTVSGDDLLFRFASLAKGTLVVSGCNSEISLIDTDEGTKCPQNITLRGGTTAAHSTRQLRSRAANVGKNSLRGTTISQSMNNASFYNSNNSSSGTFNNTNPRIKRASLRPNLHHNNSKTTQPYFTPPSIDNMKLLMRTAPGSINTDSTSSSGGGITQEIHRKLFSKPRPHEKVGGLWTVINKASRANDIMWQNAANYLQRSSLYDFNTDLQTFAPRERSSCMLHSPAIESATRQQGFIHDVVSQVKSSLQYVYDYECGIQYCPHKH